MITLLVIFLVINLYSSYSSYNLNDIEKDVLLTILRNESNNISYKYLRTNGSLMNFVEIGNDIGNCLSNKLTDAYFGRSSFKIGISGGSATQGDYAWPTMVKKYMNQKLGMIVDMRNAAQGSTSQVVSAPCLKQLIGGEGEVDLILWEFGMNDILGDDGVENHRTDDIVTDDEVCLKSPIRCAAADCWIRDAINIKPSALGFIHLWDIKIHEYKYQSNDKSNLPDRSFRPTNMAMRHYGGKYNSYFSINVMQMIHELDLVTDKTEFLRDPHHPNDYGYNIITDLFLVALLEIWIKGIDSNVSCSNVDSVHEIQPLFNIPNVIYPQENLRPHCLMSFQPQFGSYSTIVPLMLNMSNSIVHMGKADIHRTDRKDFFMPSPCEGNNGNGGLHFEVKISNPKSLFIDCGLSTQSSCRKYRIFFDELEIENHIHLNGDNKLENRINHSFLYWYGGWIHHFNLSNTQNQGELFHTLRICGMAEKVWGW